MEIDKEPTMEGSRLVRFFLIAFCGASGPNTPIRAIYEAIEEQTKTRYGYAGILQVDQIPTPMKDEMPRCTQLDILIDFPDHFPSHFLAETLKYLYLLCTNDDPVPLNAWVFNAKGHPLPVFEWSNWEKTVFNIAI